MKHAIFAISFAVMPAIVGCQAENPVGTYKATIPFQGKDPRYMGQQFTWELCLNKDASFSCTFELPMALYTEDGRELVSKAKGQVQGKWTRKGNHVILIRTSGEGSLGSTDTMSFAFHDSQLEIGISDEQAVIQETDRRIVLKRIPNKPDAGDGK